MSQQALGEMDHSLFVFDKHQMEFETLDSKLAKGIMKICPTEFEQMSKANRQANHVSDIFVLQHQ